MCQIGNAQAGLDHFSVEENTSEDPGQADRSMGCAPMSRMNQIHSRGNLCSIELFGLMAFCQLFIRVSWHRRYRLTSFSKPGSTALKKALVTKLTTVCQVLARGFSRGPATSVRVATSSRGVFSSSLATPPTNPS